MKTKYTPGQWRIASSIASDKPYLYTRKGIPGHRIIIEGADYCVAEVAGETSDECLANGRLISAAPDLLEALLGMLEPYGDTMGKLFAPETEQRINQARKAIAKATE